MSVISLGTTPIGSTSSPLALTVSNIGNATLTFTGSPAYQGTGAAADFAIPTTGCGTTLLSAASCTIDAVFAPVAIGALSETLTFASNAVNAGLATATLIGSTPSLYATTTTLTSSASSTITSQPVALTATVAGQSGLNPTGIVTFYATASGGTKQAIGTGTMTSSGSANGVATLSWPPTAIGFYGVTASYGGDSNYGSSTSSAALTITVQQPDFSFSAAASSSTVVNGSSTNTDTLTISELQGFNGVVTFSCSGLPAKAQCLFSPSSVTGAGSTSLTITTTKASVVSHPFPAASNQKTKWFSLGRGAAMACLLLFLTPRRKQRWSGIAVLMAVAVISLVAGCGGSSGPRGSTTLTLVPFTNTPATNTIDTITAAVSPTAATGTMQFTVNGTATGSPALVAGGAATYAATFTAGGTYIVVARYSGDSNYDPSTASTIALTLPYTSGSIPGTYNLTVTATSGSLTHTVAIQLTVQ